MYLSKNSRYIIQRTWYSSSVVRHCLNQTCRHYSTKLPKEDPSKPALRVNIPNDPPIDPQYLLYQLKGCIDCKPMTTPEKKTSSQVKKETTSEHLKEINQMLSKQEELKDGKVIKKSVSNEVLAKPGDSSHIQNSTSKESKSVSKIPVKIYSQNNLGKEKKILESDLKLKNKSSKEKVAVGKKVQETNKNAYVKTSLSTPEALKKPELFLELRKNNEKKKMGMVKKKAKSAENVRKQESEISLVEEIMEEKDEAVQALRRTKAQENFGRTINVAVGKKEAKSVGDLTKDQKPAEPIRISHLDNRNISVPVRDEYLAAAIESVIPKTKTVEVKMKFRVRIDRVGETLTNEEIQEGIDTAELAYELVSDESKPKTPKTRKTEKVVKDALRTIVEKAKDVLEDRRLSKSVTNLKEQKVQMVQIQDIPQEKISKYGKKLTFEVKERNDKNKVVNFKRFPLPKTRLEKSVSYHGKLGESNVKFLSNDRFQISGEDFELNAVARRSPKNPSRILKPLASQIQMVDEVPEYLKYPEFKYVGLSSTASRNFHQTASQCEYRKDFPEKRSVLLIDSMVKGKEGRSPGSSKEMIVSRPVTSVQKGTSKPMHMSIPVVAKTNEKAEKEKWYYDTCRKGLGSPLRKTRSRIARPYKNYNIPKNNSVLSLNERLAQQKYIPEISSPEKKTAEVFFKSPDVGTSTGALNKKEPTEEEKLNTMMPGLLIGDKPEKKDEGGKNEDVTDYTKNIPKPQKDISDKTIQNMSSQGNIETRNRAGKDFSKEKTIPEKTKTFKEMYPPEFEFNPKCVNEYVKKIPVQGEKNMKCMPRKRFRFHRTPRWTKDNIINVMKPPITPKLSDNLVNVANEPLNASKGPPSVDSLRMMEKVKKMLDFDLKNAEKIFVPENWKKASSVLQLVREPWGWKVNAEELEKRAAEKSSKKVTSDVSVVCLNHENHWKTTNLPENVEFKKIGGENSSALYFNSKSKSYWIDETFLNEMKKKAEEDFHACKGYDCEMKKVQGNRQMGTLKPLEVKSVVALNSNSNSDRDRFSIVHSELTQCLENTTLDLDSIVYDMNAVECCKNVKGTSAVLCKNDGFVVDQQTLKLEKEKQSGETGIASAKNVEIKNGESILLFDEKNRSSNIDSSKSNQTPIVCKSKEAGDFTKPAGDFIHATKKIIDLPKPKKSPEKIHKFIQNKNLPLRKIVRMQRKAAYMYDYSSVKNKSSLNLQCGKRTEKTIQSPPKTPYIIEQVTTQVQSQEKKKREDVYEPIIVTQPIKPKDTAATISHRDSVLEMRTVKQPVKSQEPVATAPSRESIIKQRILKSPVKSQETAATTPARDSASEHRIVKPPVKQQVTAAAAPVRDSASEHRIVKPPVKKQVTAAAAAVRDSASEHRIVKPSVKQQVTAATTPARDSASEHKIVKQPLKQQAIAAATPPRDTVLEQKIVKQSIKAPETAATTPPVIEPKTVKPPVKQKETVAAVPPSKKTEKEHYVSDNILEMTKSPPPEKTPAVKSNIGETVKVDVSSAEHPPSKITEINLNKDSHKTKTVPEKTKSESKIFDKDFEKYQTPYSEPDYEDKPIKINSDIKSNPNMKKLDSSKTTVLNDVSKPTENLDSWLRDETDKMTNLLIKVLQEATEAKSKRKLLISSKIIDKHAKKTIASKTKSSDDVVKSCKVTDLRKKKPGEGKSKPKNISEIPVQTSKNIQPPKTVDAVDMNSMSVANQDFKAASEKVNKEIFDVVPQELIDPIGVNAENLTDFNIKKVEVPTSALKLNADSLKKFLKIKDIPVKPILPANLEENRAMAAAEEADDFPGPEGLKKWSLVWKYLPAVGCQATVWIFQLAQIGASLFGSYSSSKFHNRTFNKLFSKYGPIVKLPGPLGGEVVLINRPEHIKSIFDQEGKRTVRSVLDSVDRCRIASRSKSAPFFNLEDWKGSDWEEVRKILSDSAPKTEKYFDFFQNAGRLLVKRIQSNRDVHYQTSEDFMNEIRRWSLECMCYVVFDRSFGFLNFNTFDWSLEANRLMKLLTEATDCILRCENGFQIWRFVDTPASIVLSKACQSIESIVGKHVRHSEINLAKKKQDLLSGKYTAADLNLIEHMLLIDGLSYDEIVYTVLDLFLIGVNTSSSALGFLLYRLAQNTRVQRKLFKEVKNVLPDKNSELSYHRLHSLKYLQACLKESLRLNAPVPLLIRNLHHDMSVADYKVSKGTIVVMDTQVSCMKDQNFEDPEKYSPERWLDPGHMDFTTVPFCHGSKAEIGKRLAEMQIWACAAQLVRNFQIEYNYGDIKGTEEVISFPDKPLKLSFIDRED